MTELVPKASGLLKNKGRVSLHHVIHLKGRLLLSLQREATIPALGSGVG